jgi:hypothetical protein
MLVFNSSHGGIITVITRQEINYILQIIFWKADISRLVWKKVSRVDTTPPPESYNSESIPSHLTSLKFILMLSSMAVLWLSRLVVGLSQRRSGFAPRSVHVGFVVNEVALEQVFLKHFLVLPCQYHSPVALHPHILLGGWTIGQWVAAAQTHILTLSTLTTVLSSHLCLGLPSVLLPSRFPEQNSPCISYLPLSATYPTHLILLDWSP